MKKIMEIMGMVLRNIREVEDLNRQMEEVVKNLNDRLISVERNKDGELVFALNRVTKRYLTETEERLIKRYIELDDRKESMLRGA